MALDQSALADALFGVFQSMGSDADFAEGVAGAVKAYAEKGEVTTMHTGSFGGGVIQPGTSGTGSPSFAAALLQSPLEAVVAEGMPSGNAGLAAAIMAGCQAMLSAPNTLSQRVNGVSVVPGSPPITVPITNVPAAGQIMPVMAPLAAQMLAIFGSMDGMSEDGDRYLADEMASAIHLLLVGSSATAAMTAGLDVGTGAIM